MDGECISRYGFFVDSFVMITCRLYRILVLFQLSRIGRASLSLLRASTSPPPQAILSQSLSLDSLSRDTFDPPSIQDYKVEPITSEQVPILRELVEEQAEQKRKSQYTSLSEEQLKIEVKMGSIESPIRYLVTPPPSTCDGATGPAAKLLDCATTFPRVVITGV